MNEEALFWSDKIADEILKRKKFYYLDKQTPKLKKYTVKSSASISGVLHIGRLSDTIRGEAVYRSLLDRGVNAEFIWVAEDMDPLRKIPKGVPKKFEQYIGAPVTEIPDPWGCHKSYAEHHKSKFFKILDQFIAVKPKIFSMRAEYKQGNFYPYIKKLLQNLEQLRQILNKYRREPLEKWSPWQPVCDQCGKIMTPRLIGVKNGKVRYQCEDYQFEKYTAKGCGYEGVSDPRKGNGKLVWKSEWASQWARWKIVSEGAGKEYIPPGSAWWGNAEICERIFNFPMPIPIFYEYLMIDGQKMSASLGNVIYPKDWLKVASPEVLRYLFLKRIMKTRSFSWKDLPRLVGELEDVERVYFGLENARTEKEKAHLRKLYKMTLVETPKRKPVRIPYQYAAIIAQTVVKPEDELERALYLLRKTGHVDHRLPEEDKERTLERLKRAKYWAQHYAPESLRFKVLEKYPKEIVDRLSRKQKEALKAVGRLLETKLSMDELESKLFDTAKKYDLTFEQFFGAAYQVLLGKEEGPRLAPLLLSIEDLAIQRFRQIKTI